MSRLTVINLPVYERNILIVGNEYCFEGRKLDIKGGFDATNIFSEPDVVEREIELFDELFENGLAYVRKEKVLPGGKQNKALIEYLIDVLNRDLEKLNRRISKRGH